MLRSLYQLRFARTRVVCACVCSATTWYFLRTRRCCRLCTHRRGINFCGVFGSVLILLKTKTVAFMLWLFLTMVFVNYVISGDGCDPDSVGLLSLDAAGFHHYQWWAYNFDGVGLPASAEGGALRLVPECRSFVFLQPCASHEVASKLAITCLNLILAWLHPRLIQKEVFVSLLLHLRLDQGSFPKVTSIENSGVHRIDVLTSNVFRIPPTGFRRSCPPQFCSRLFSRR